MKVVLGIYVGIQYFLEDDYVPSNEDADQLSRAEIVAAALSKGEVQVKLDGLGIKWSSPVLEEEVVLGDSEPGLPFLVYINAIFTPSSADEEKLLDAEDELDEQLTAVLYAGELAIPYNGIFELETDDEEE